MFNEFTPTHLVTVGNIPTPAQFTPYGYWTGTTYIDPRNIRSIRSI